MTGRFLLWAVCGIFALCLAFALTVGIVQNAYSWSNASPPPFIATIDIWKLGMVTGSAGTAAALLVTLYITDRNYRRSRERIPSLSMELKVDRTSVSARYHAVIATLDAKNTGTGLCRIGQVDWVVTALAPYDDETIEEMRKEFSDAARAGEAPDIVFPWAELERASATPGNLIRPNETDQITCDFIIPAAVTAIAVSVWVADASDLQHTAGWYRRVVHIDEES